jgi:hypothetical protein
VTTVRAERDCRLLVPEKVDRQTTSMIDRSLTSTTRRGKMASARICGIPDAFAAKKPRQV